jgi:hypothetical protein
MGRGQSSHRRGAIENRSAGDGAVSRACILAVWLVTAAAPEAATVVDFESAEIGRAPDGFTVAQTGRGGQPAWVARDDPTAPSGRKVLVQTSTDATGSRFPLCVYDALSAADVDVSVEFKPLDGTVDQAAGLVWRYQSPDDYYLVRANALEGNVVLYKVRNGKRSDLKPVGGGLRSYGKKATVRKGIWQKLAIHARGSHFTVSLNGEPLFEVDDATLRGPGRVGLWTKADSVTAFDDLTIAPGAGGSPTTTPDDGP